LTRGLNFPNFPNSIVDFKSRLTGIFACPEGSQAQFAGPSGCIHGRFKRRLEYAIFNPPMTVTPESIQTLLDSAEAGDRMTAVNQLRQIDPAIAFDLIQAAIADANVRVRYAAVSQLSSLGTQDRAKSLTVLRDRLNHDPEPDVQAAAADAIGALKLTEAFEELKSLYETSSEWLVKFSIVAALGELGDERAFGLLEEALQSDNELVKTAAVGSLGELGDRRAVAVLLPLVQDSDWQIRYRVAQALSRFEDPEALAALKTLAGDDMEAVANEAQSYL
jgi:HEAT repeat protein